MWYRVDVSLGDFSVVGICRLSPSTIPSTVAKISAFENVQLVVSANAYI
jgi:hypothetical protein